MKRIFHPCSFRRRPGNRTALGGRSSGPLFPKRGQVRQAAFLTALYLAMGPLVRADFVAYNDQASGPATHPNTTLYGLQAVASGPMKEIETGEELPVILTVSQSGGVSVARMTAPPAAGTDAGDIFLDYQVLKQGAASQQLLISIMSRRIVEGLEEAFEEAGFFVSVIDFHALNCFNYYTPIFEGINDFSFICCEDGILNFFYFADRTLGYYRSRAMVEKGDALFHEIQRSIIDCRNHHGAILQNPLYFHGDAGSGLSLFSSLNSFFSGRTVFLDAGLEKFFRKKSDFPPDLSQSLAAAAGAGQRLMADR